MTVINNRGSHHEHGACTECGTLVMRYVEPTPAQCSREGRTVLLERNLETCLISLCSSLGAIFTHPALI